MTYTEYCRQEYVPLMMQDWWLDAVCPEQWSAVLYEEGGKPVASFVYHLRRKYGLRFMIQPQLTQYSGLWMRPSNVESLADYNRLCSEQHALDYFIDHIRTDVRPHYTSINIHHTVKSHLPFLWKGYRETLRYTYMISDISNVEKCVSLFSDNKRRNIKKAEGKFDFCTDMLHDEFYAFHRSVIEQCKGGKILYSNELFLRLWNAATERGQGCILSLRDKDTHEIAVAHFIVWDSKTAYDLLYAIAPKYAHTGASSLAVAEIFKWLSGHTQGFDFEGSIEKGVEQSYRQFGTRQRPYHHIYKVC